MSVRVFFFFVPRVLLHSRTLTPQADKKKKLTHVTVFVSASSLLQWKFICYGNSACFANMHFFLWKLSCHMCVPWILYHPNDPALARGNSKSSRRSCSWLPLHPFWTGNMRLCVLFRFDLISKTAAPTVYYTVGRSCVSIISLFGQFTRRPRTVSKGTRVTVTQSVYCRDKQTGLIQPKQHY